MGAAGNAVGVHVEDAEGVRRITLDRAPVNALSLAEYDALADAFDTAADAARVVLLRAEGRVWSAGQDLAELAPLTGPGELADYLVRATRGVSAAARCPVPVLTRLHGPAIGAGALLVACSDIVVGTNHASLAFPEVRIGLRLGRALVADLLPPMVLAHAFATGLAIPGTRLHDLGVLSELVPEEELDDRVDALVADLLAVPDESLRWLRSAQRRGTAADAYLAEVAAAT